MPALVEKMGRWARPRTVAVVVAAAVLLASSIWFFTARDERGRTSRLTADAWYYHAFLPSLAYDRDLDFSDEYQTTGNWYRFGKTELGRPANVFGVGPAVFEMPAFLTGALFTKVTGGRADGFSTAEVKLSLYMSLLFSLGALFFAGRVIRRRFDAPYLAMAVPILVACAGPVVYYAIRQPGYAHPFATFWTAWLIDRWDSSFDEDGARPLGTWLALGALLGAAALARPQAGLWAIILVAAVADDVARLVRAGQLGELPRQAGRWAAGAALCGLVFLPQPLAWHSLYGSFLLTPQGPGFMRWHQPEWGAVLFSSRNGLLPWAPLLALASVGIVVACVRRPRLGVALAAGVVLQVLANGAAWDWWAGGSFGGRRFDSCFAAFSIGLAALLAWRGRAEEPGARMWIRRTAVGLGLALAALLAAGNLRLASMVSAPSARIHGGQAASVVLRGQVSGPLGALLGDASDAVTWPARHWFAWRWGAGDDAYDYVVGTNQLGELYPGLNSFRGKQRDRLHLIGVPRKLVGFVRKPDGMALAGDSGTILLGLNRFDPVEVTVKGRGGAASGTVALEVAGATIGSAQVTPGQAVNVSGTIRRPQRGVNGLRVIGPPGTLLQWVDLRATGDPRGDQSPAPGLAVILPLVLFLLALGTVGVLRPGGI